MDQRDPTITMVYAGPPAQMGLAMDRMVGSDFAIGLVNLKTLAMPWVRVVDPERNPRPARLLCPGATRALQEPLGLSTVGAASVGRLLRWG